MTEERLNEIKKWAEVDTGSMHPVRDLLAYVDQIRAELADVKKCKAEAESGYYKYRDLYGGYRKAYEEELNRVLDLARKFIASELARLTVVEALKSLSVEAKGFLSLVNPADTGHTNISVMRHWIEVANEALAAQPAESVKQ